MASKSQMTRHWGKREKNYIATKWTILATGVDEFTEDHINVSIDHFMITVTLCHLAHEDERGARRSSSGTTATATAALGVPVVPLWRLAAG